jgi:hypothetical protein
MPADLSGSEAHKEVVGTTIAEPYFIGLGRAMVSLGPLANSAYCTYKCKFCYVNGPYPKYAHRSVDEILDWLHRRRDDYGIVYVSGDTDSFAPPRTGEALRLLSQLIELGVDVLFTTRYVFSNMERRIVNRLLREYNEAGRLLIPCISVSQLTHPELEPPPIPSPGARISQIRWLYAQGAKVLLTVRPFIPYVDAEEYAEIVRRGGRYCTAVLGGDWYTDPNGIIDGLTRRALGVAITKVTGNNVTRAPLDSTTDATEWDTSRHPHAEVLVEQVSRQLDRPFFMRSEPAVTFIRQHGH